MAANLLDDFLDSIEHLPAQLSHTLNGVQQKEAELHQLHRSLHRHRCIYLNRQSSSPSKTGHLQKRIEKEMKRWEGGMLEKVEMEESMLIEVSVLLDRLDAEAKRMGLDIVGDEVVLDLPELHE